MKRAYVVTLVAEMQERTNVGGDVEALSAAKEAARELLHLKRTELFDVVSVVVWKVVRQGGGGSG